MLNFLGFSKFRFVTVFVGAALLASASCLAQGDTYKPGAGKPKTRPAQDLRNEGPAVFGGGKDKGKPDAAGDWSIVVVAFRGDTAQAEARAALETVRSQTRLDAFVEARGAAYVIAYGHYPDAASKQAKADLDRIRAVEVMFDGRPARPFSGAMLAPPAEIPGSRPEWDLRNAKRTNGEWAIYTLQVGVYSREDRKPTSPADLAEFRKMAEQAVALLRREGELAFYYHGPNRSMVTIGLWGEEDFDGTTHLDLNPGLGALRKRFPYNLQNGMGIKQRVTVTDPKSGQQIKQERMQPSSLVAVPKD
jgi:hypothetical protein